MIILTIVVLSLASIVGNNDKLQAYATNNSTSNNQQLDDVLKVTAKTNKQVYGYGEPILLNTKFNNVGSQIINISSDLRPYAGLPHSCSNESYFDFVLLNGSGFNIKSYDDLLRLKDKAVYLFNSPLSCLEYIRAIKSAEINPNNGNVTVSYFSGRTGNETAHYTTGIHSFQYRIRHMYEAGKNEVGNPFAKSQPLPVGKYTIVAFTMSGQISEPIEIKVTAIPDSSFIVIIGIAAIAGAGIMVLMPKR